MTAGTQPSLASLLGIGPGTRILVLDPVDDHGPAEDWPVAYAATLARLHAATIREDAGRLRRWSAPSTDDVAAFQRRPR